MQKDIHYYSTLALAVKAGIDFDTALKIAWANQYTDELTKAEIGGLQTQVDVTDAASWSQRQIQLTVLAAFHFMPGDDKDNLRIVTENSSNSRKLLSAAVEEKDPFWFGITLHVLQDTYSHQGFTGWEEDVNACPGWFRFGFLTPNIGHTDFHRLPDIADAIWTDWRTGETVNNKERAMAAMKETYFSCARYNQRFESNSIEVWVCLYEQLRQILDVEYEERKKKLMALIGCKLSGRSYSEIKNNMWASHYEDFVGAAQRHLSQAISIMSER